MQVDRELIQLLELLGAPEHVIRQAEHVLSQEKLGQKGEEPSQEKDGALDMKSAPHEPSDREMTPRRTTPTGMKIYEL